MPRLTVCSFARWAFLVAAGLSAAAYAGPQPRYRLAPLPTTDPQFQVFGARISNAGQIAGVGFRADFHTVPVVWIGGVPADLPTIAGGPAYNCAALGVNNDGVAVGRSAFTHGFPGAFDYRATVWVGGALTDLGTLPGHTASAAEAINNDGAIVGWSTDNFVPFFGPTTPVRWVGSVLEALPAPGLYEDTRAFDINSAGTAAGTAIAWNDPIDPFSPVAGRAVIWTAAGGLVELDPAAGHTVSTGRAINDGAQVAGDSGPVVFIEFEPGWFFDTYFPHAAVWTGGEPRLLGELPGDSSSTVLGHNNSGVAIGVSGEPTIYGGFHVEGRPVIWRDGGPVEFGTLVDPSTPGWTVTALNAINDRGVIVGSGVFDGQPAGFVATPVYGR